jgi:Zn-dependent protease with chaperone function
VNHLSLVLPLLVAATFGVTGPAVARRLPPRHAVWLLSAGGAIATLSALAVLALLGFVLVAQQPDVAREGHWSVSALRAHAPVDRAVGAAALVAAAAAAVVLVVVALRRGRALHAAYRSARSLDGAGGELVVADDPSAGAYAVPGHPGRIVVGTRLLAALSGPERRALLAHERAHLDHGHHWHLAAVALTAGVNPLLAPLRQAAEHAVERAADEYAAAQVGDRRVVASALARAALFRGAHPAAAFAAAAHAVPVRVAALLASPPRPRPLLVGLMLLVLLLALGSALLATEQTDHLVDFAMRVQSGR